MVAPPSEAGADQLTTDEALATVPVTPVGAPGYVAGANAEGPVAEVPPALFPFAFVATTVKTYGVPLVRPVTVQVVSVVVVHIAPPGEAVTEYPVIADPLDDGAVQEIVTARSPITPVTDEGVPGTVDGVAEPEDPAEPFPIELCAVTEKVYEVPLVRPETTQLVVPVVHVNDPGEEVTV